MTKIYAEFENGDRETFRGITEDHAMCNVIAYAEEHGTNVEYYTDITDFEQSEEERNG